MPAKNDKLEEWQLKHYQETELPRLQRILTLAANKAGGSTVDLIRNAKKRFQSLGYKLVTSNDISGLKRDKTKGPIKNSAITDRTIYRLALLLDIDDDITWGALALRLYLSGKIDNLEKPTISAIKEACRLKPDIHLDFNALHWLENANTSELRDISVAAIKRLAKESFTPDSDENTPLYGYIESVLISNNKTIQDLLMNTALTNSSLELLKRQGAISGYELGTLAEWVAELTGEVITSDSIAERAHFTITS